MHKIPIQKIPTKKISQVQNIYKKMLPQQNPLNKVGKNRCYTPPSPIYPNHGMWRCELSLSEHSYIFILFMNSNSNNVDCKECHVEFHMHLEQLNWKFEQRNGLSRNLSEISSECRLRKTSTNSNKSWQITEMFYNINAKKHNKMI